MNFVECPYKGAELMPLEREFLARWIVMYRPKNIIEVGTGRGGSTYYMAESIKEFEIPCKIYTCDPRRKPTNEFFEQYPFVLFYKIYSTEFIDIIIKNQVPVDFIFFDGPDNPHVALQDIQTLESHITSGTHFAMHDWYFEKAQLIRPYIMHSDRWSEIEVLKKSEKSVGLCLYEFLG